MGMLFPEEDAEGRRLMGRLCSVFSSPMATDSGTTHNVFVSILLDVATLFEVPSRFGRPLAAAAHESRVDRLALKAAS